MVGDNNRVATALAFTHAGTEKPEALLFQFGHKAREIRWRRAIAPREKRGKSFIRNPRLPVLAEFVKGVPFSRREIPGLRQELFSLFSIKCYKIWLHTTPDIIHQTASKTARSGLIIFQFEL